MTTAVFLSLPTSMKRIVDGKDFGPIIRQEVIDRWCMCVDHVLSVNAKEEVKELASQIKRVEIVPVPGTVQIQISQIRKIAAERDFDTIAIANADCVPMDVKLTKELIGSTQSNAAVFLRRANVNCTSKLASLANFYGNDVFILGKQAYSQIPNDTYWKIGQPVWDIWLPLFMTLRGAKTSGVDGNLFMHFDHQQRWSFEDWRVNARQLVKEFEAEKNIRILPFWPADPKAFSRMNDKELQIFFERVSEYLYLIERPKGIQYHDFNSLWIKVLKANFGPDDKRYDAYVNASSKPIKRWLIRKIMR